MVTPPPLSPTEVLTNVAGALFTIPIIFGLFIKAPKLVVFGFIAILFCFSDSTWGQLQTQSNIYSRGVGVFNYSLVNLILFTAGIAALLKRLANPNGPHVAPQITKYLLAFSFLLFGHVVIGLMSEIDLTVILGYGGVLNIFNMLVFIYLVIIAFENDDDTRKLLLMIVALAAIRALFGAARYVLLGGDPSNPYRNFEGMNITIFYFDIGDNYIAALGAFCAAWLLTSQQGRIGFFQRLLLLGFIALEIAAVALSFRRSSLIGLGLMFLFLFLRLPGHRKLFFALLAAGLLVTVAIVFFRQRLQFTDAGPGGVLGSLIYDISPGRGGIRDNRFYELYAAAQSLEGHWLFGRGTWGTFTGDTELLSYHGNDFSFVHSGFGHILLKTGIVGLALFCSLLGGYVKFYLRHRNALGGNARLIADAGFAGFLFWIPTLLVGTPIIEFRTMLLIGLTLAMPFVAVGMQDYLVRQYLSRAAYALT